jgi:large subunit ribosomal protein L17
MRHLKSGYHLNRTRAHRKALLSNLSAALFERKRIKTTLAKAKATRSVAEKFITFAKKGDLASRRQVLRYIPRKDVVKTLFEEIAPKYAERAGGYSRIVKLGQRQGDGAPMAILELVGFETSAAPKKAATKKKAEKAEDKDKKEEPKARETKPKKTRKKAAKPAKEEVVESAAEVEEAEEAEVEVVGEEAAPEDEETEAADVEDEVKAEPEVTEEPEEEPKETTEEKVTEKETPPVGPEEEDEDKKKEE